MRTIAAILVLLVTSTGCLKTRAQLRDQSSDDLRNYNSPRPAQQVAQREVRETAPARPASASSIAVRMEEYDEQLRQLNGRIDVVENSINQMNAGRQGDKDSVDREKQALNAKLTAYEEAIKKLEEQVLALSTEVEKLKAPPAPAPVASTPPTKAGGAKSANPRQPYDDGETFLAQKKWKDAIMSYQKYRDQFPKGRMYADATYKIGVCFQELGMVNEAKAFYDEVTVKFPGSKEAKKAMQRLKTLK